MKTSCMIANGAVNNSFLLLLQQIKLLDGDPILLPISDDDSVYSSLYSQDSESEGGIWDNQHNDDVSIAPDGVQANSIR